MEAGKITQYCFRASRLGGKNTDDSSLTSGITIGGRSGYIIDNNAEIFRPRIEELKALSKSV